MAEITISELTSGNITGDGVFDKLMEASTVRLDDAFTKNRISATDYSRVLIESMTAAMQQSIAFVLGKQDADARAELTKAQTELTNAQKLVADQELLNAQAQKIILDKQAHQLDAELLQTQAQTAILTENLNAAVAETALRQQELTNLVNANLKIVADTSLVDQQLLNLQQDLAQSQAEVALINQNKLNAEKQNDVLTNQITKIGAEVALLTQKRTTEEAQTSAIADEGSLIGKQIALYDRQADGFLRDAEQKAAKLLVDTWNVRQSTDGALASPAGLSDASIKDAIDTLKTGINTGSSGLSISYVGARAVSNSGALASLVTEQGNGDIYYIATENPTETAGTVLNSITKEPVSNVGRMSFSVNGLTTATTYYVHMVHYIDANTISEVASSSAFTTL